MNDPAARLAVVRHAVPVDLDGAVLVESYSNDTWNRQVRASRVLAR
jgi:hypothetical protein